LRASPTAGAALTNFNFISERNERHFVFLTKPNSEGKKMTTGSGHTSAILASKVKGTNIYNLAGDKIGHVEDVVLDKQSDSIMFAALGFGGVLGMGEKFFPVPWSMLDYNPDKGGYVVPLSKDVLERAPTYRLEDLTKNDGEFSQIRAKSYDYYKVPRDF
jgi:sporulation protein YlmC with PRC-barrel domain